MSSLFYKKDNIKYNLIIKFYALLINEYAFNDLIHN